jgi:hypothetical protein
MLESALGFVKLPFAEATKLFDVLHQETGKTDRILANILPLLSDKNDAHKLLMRATKGRRKHLARVKLQMGSTLKAFSALTDGYYCLDLSDESSRRCIRQLLQINEDLRKYNGGKHPIGQQCRIGDTSQKGNWSCFRNEFLYTNPKEPGRPIVLTLETYNAEIPKKGIIEFDFMSFRQPPPPSSSSLKAISTKRLFAVLESCFIMMPYERLQGKEQIPQLQHTIRFCVSYTFSLFIHSCLKHPHCGLLLIAGFPPLQQRWSS